MIQISSFLAIKIKTGHLREGSYVEIVYMDWHAIIFNDHVLFSCNITESYRSLHKARQLKLIVGWRQLLWQEAVFTTGILYVISVYLTSEMFVSTLVRIWRCLNKIWLGQWTRWCTWRDTGCHNCQQPLSRVLDVLVKRLFLSEINYFASSISCFQ